MAILTMSSKMTGSRTVHTRLMSGTAAVVSCLFHGAGAAAEAPAIQVAMQAVPPAIVGSSVTGSAREEGGFVYRIGPEDRLKVTVRNEPELSGEFRVRPDGYFTMLLVGDIPADRRRPEDLAAEITAALARYIRDPSVTVEVIEAHGTFEDRIRFIGKGVPPQTIAYRDGMTALDALAEIGGLPPTAAANRVTLLRESERRRVRMGDIASRAANNIALEPGDILIVPESFLAGTRIFEPSITVAETWTDNINFRQGDLKEDSYISEIIPAFRLEYDTARLNALLDSTVRLQYRTNVEDEIRINPNIRGTSTTEIVEDLIFGDLDAAINRTVIDNRRSGSSNPANSNNTQLLQTWSASPYLKSSFGSLANLEARWTSTATLVGSPPDEIALEPVPGLFSNPLRNDSFTHTASFRLTDATQRSRLTWQLYGQWRWIEIRNQADSRRREIILSPEYAVTPEFFLIAEVGYQNFEGAFSRNVDDPLYVGGFRWQPDDDVLISARAGQRDGRTAYFANIQLPFGRYILFNASASTSTQFDVERLAGSIRNPDPGTPDGLPPGGDGILRDTPTRNTTIGATLSASIGNTTYSLNGRYQKVEPGITNVASDQETLRISASFRQVFARYFAFDASGYYTQRKFRQTLVDGGIPRQDDDFGANAGLSYNGFGPFSVRIGYNYTERDSTIDLADFSENSVTLSVTHRF
ncbi:MAG: hypothetical protein Tsb008_03050 [Rhodothalassiaceae bacterium]